jgi:membrane-bound lytic murein transglycosylase D
MKYAGSTLLLILLPTMAITLYAQTFYPDLPSKTRIKFENRLTSVTGHLRPDKEKNRDLHAPHIWPSSADITSFLENAGKTVPVVNKEKTSAFLMFYAYEYPAETNLILGLAKDLQKKFGQIFENHSLPPELAYYPLVSSPMLPDYVSDNGGVGNWHFKYSTARLYGLMVDEYIDERRLSDKSTQAAAQMLKDFYASFETNPLAVAAMICGPARVNMALKNTKNPNNLKQVFSQLPEPEIDTYHAFTALNILIHHPEKFNLSPADYNSEKPKDTVLVKDTLHFGQISEFTGIQEKDIEMLNPQYVKNVIPASSDVNLPLLLPDGISEIFLTCEDKMYHYKDSFYFKPAAPGTQNKHTPGNDYVPVQYTVKSGDNIGFIAEWFDTTAAEIRYWNNTHGNFIVAGQQLVIYVPKSKQSDYAALETMRFAEKQAREGKTVSETSPKHQIKKELKHGTYILYTVKPGDNPWQIAQQFSGISDQDILRWNNINPHDIRPGQKLKIKKQGSK